MSCPLDSIDNATLQTIITAAGVIVAVATVIVSVCLQNQQHRTNRRNELLDKIVSEHQAMIALLLAIKNFRATQLANHEKTPTETLNSQWVEFERLCGDFLSALSRFNISCLLIRKYVDVQAVSHLDKLSELGQMVEDLLVAAKGREWTSFALNLDYRTELTKRLDDYVVQPRDQEFQLFMTHIAKLLSRSR